MTSPIEGNPNLNSLGFDDTQFTAPTGSLDGQHTISSTGTDHLQEISSEVSSVAEPAIGQLGTNEEIMAAFSETSELFRSNLQELLSKLGEAASRVETMTQDSLSEMDSLVEKTLSTAGEATRGTEASREKSQDLFLAIRSSLSSFRQLCTKWINRMFLSSAQGSSQRGSASESYRPEVSAPSDFLITSGEPKVQWSKEFREAAAYYGLEGREGDDGRVSLVDGSAQGTESIYEVPDPIDEEENVYEEIPDLTLSTEHSYSAARGADLLNNESDMASHESMSGSLHLWDIGQFQEARNHLTGIVERGDTITRILNDIENSPGGVSNATLTALDTILQGLNALRASLEMRLDEELPFVSDA